MKARNTIFKSLFIFFLIVSGIGVSAQNLYTVNVQKSDLKVNGTSTLHDWFMNGEFFDCTVKALNNKDRLIIQKVNFSCNSTSLKSENSLMDKKAWEALKTKNFKTIVFESTDMVELVLKSNKIEGKLVGDLTLSGLRRKITVPFTGVIEESGNLKFNGEVKVKMSEFGIAAPTALMGSIKTGDEIRIVFDLYFTSTSLTAKGN
jgi:polyisoprenoid-binding protein YceI